MVIFRSCADNLLGGYELCRPPTQNFRGDRPPCPHLDYARVLMVKLITDIVINTLLGRLTLDPAGMHCRTWDDAFIF